MPWQLTLVNREVRLIDPRWTYSLCESFLDSRPDSSRDLAQRIYNLQGLISWPHSADISSQRRARAPCCSGVWVLLSLLIVLAIYQQLRIYQIRRNSQKQEELS